MFTYRLPARSSLSIVWSNATPPGGVAFDQTMLSELRAGNLYVNVQTRARPSGEVRGQVLPE